MCVAGQPAGPAAPPSNAGQALAALHSALAYLATADATALTTAEQADCLRSLERAEAARTAAHARVLAAFSAGCGYQDDGHGSARSWLRWRARITGPAAAAAMAWTRRLTAHPAVAAALAAAAISASWARQICDWTDLLPETARPDADTILLAAAAAGAELADLAGLADEMRSRTAAPEEDGDDDGSSRSVRLDLHYRGHGHLRGDLTPRCAAAFQAILDALGKKRGPEDTRTKAQRDHDAIEEACRRLIGAGTLPDRAGQPTQIQLYLTLHDLLNLPPGHGDPRGRHHARRHQSGDTTGRRQQAGVPGPDPGPAALQPHRPRTRRLDRSRTPRHPRRPVRRHYHPRRHRPRRPRPPRPPRRRPPSPRQPTAERRPPDNPAPAARQIPRPRSPPDHPGPGSPLAAARLGPAYARELILRTAIALLSGPAGLASRLRTGRLTGPAASISLPLDVGAATETIPPHLRRAVILRDAHCTFPGCDQPPAACQVHHVIPRAQGGPTSLANLLLTCTFHHLIAIHQWGWTLILNADGTKTAISPDRTRTLHSHSPPRAA